MRRGAAVAASVASGAAAQRLPDFFTNAPLQSVLRVVFSPNRVEEN
jgi:hypothetical protein